MYIVARTITAYACIHYTVYICTRAYKTDFPHGHLHMECTESSKHTWLSSMGISRSIGASLHILLHSGMSLVSWWPGNAWLLSDCIIIPICYTATPVAIQWVVSTAVTWRRNEVLTQLAHSVLEPKQLVVADWQCRVALNICCWCILLKDQEWRVRK